MKHKLVGLLIAVASTLAFAVTANAAPTLWNFIMFGQSNMEGRTLPSNWPASVTYPTRIWNFRFDTRQWQNPAPRAIQGLNAGPQLAFADKMTKNRPGIHVGIISCAVSNTSAADWQWGRTSDSPYANCLAAVKQAKASCPAQYTGGCKVAGGFYWQGESNTMTTADAQDWVPLTHAMWANFRHDLGALDLPLVYVQLPVMNPPNLVLFPKWSYLRGQQPLLASTQNFIGTVSMVNTNDLTITDGDAHPGTAIVSTIANRAADAMHALLPAAVK